MKRKLCYKTPMASIFLRCAVIFAIIFTLMSCTKKEATSTVATKQVSNSKITSAADLVGKTIGVQAGTTGEDCAKAVEGAVVKSLKTGIDAALALKNNAIDAIIIDELPAQEIVKNNKDFTLINGAFEPEYYAIAVQKGNSELLEQINKTIERVKEDGTYEQLVSSFMPIDGNIRIPEIDFIDSVDVIKMGTNAAFPPFEYTEGQDVLGFDVSLGKIIAKDSNKAIKVIDMNFDALIAALQSGAVDFVAAGMTATDERRENVDFSEPYYTSNQVIIVKQ